MLKSDKQTGNHLSAPYGFEIRFKEDEKYYFQFNDAEGEPLLFSKGYGSEKICKEAVLALLRSARNEVQYDLHETKKGEYYFTVKTGNHKEIARSRIFDDLGEVKTQVDRIKNIDQKAPVYGLTDAPVEVPDKIRTEKKKSAESARTKTGLFEKEDGKSVRPEDTEKMPRYKFSVIYYPDSKVWMIKNDFSGDSTQMKTCDGRQIESFIIAQLPADEMKPPTVPIEQEIPEKDKTVTPSEPPIIPAMKEAELILQNHQGQWIHKFATIGSMDKIEILPKIESKSPHSSFDVRILAKSFEGNQITIIGMVENQSLVNGRLVVPIHAANRLLKGLYRFIADIHEKESGRGTSSYHGSQLIMLN